MYVAEKSHKNEECIKKKIVSAYRAGKCDHNGVTLPGDKWGMAGKGCHFSPPPTEEYRTNYVKIFGHN